MHALNVQTISIRDTGGRLITPKRMRRGLMMITLAGTLGSVFWTVIPGMPLIMLLEALGASGLLIGSIGTVFQLGMVTQIPATFFLESLRKRKGFWAFTAGLSRIIYLLPVLALWLLPSSQAPWIIAVLMATTIIAALAHHASLPCWMSWMADLVPSRRRGRYWGQRQIWCMAAFLVANALVGHLLDGQTEGSLSGFAWALFLAAVLGTADVIVHSFVPEPKGSVADRTVRWTERMWKPFVGNRDFLYLTLAMSLWMFCFGFVKPFGDVYLKRAFDVPYTDLAALQIAISVGAIVAGWAASMLTDRVGARSFAVSLLILFPFLHIFWFFLRPETLEFVWPVIGRFSVRQPTLLLFVGLLIRGMIGSCVMLSYITLTASLTSEKGRSMVMAVHSTFVGMVSALGPLAGGWVMDIVTAHPIPWQIAPDLPFSFYHLILIVSAVMVWGVIVPLFLRIRPGDREISIAQTMRHVFFANPARLARNMYNLYVVDSGADRDRRAKAVYRLGQAKNEMAVQDLIARLDDPAADVREQAVYALGHIGTTEAVEALVEKLSDPHSDLGPQIARSLRQSRAPVSVDALMDKLREPDRETQSESARTLGEIGDRRAGPSLLQLLQQAREDKIIAASSEALARLGELAAIYEIIPRMRGTRNPVLKRSLAVAIGDLLGDEHEFYKLLIREMQEPAMALEVMINSIRRKARKRLDAQTEAQGLFEKLSRIEDACLSGDNRSALECCGAFALQLAAMMYGIEHGRDTRAIAEELLWRNQKLGLIVWMIMQLLERSDDDPPIDPLETLLALYAINQWEG